MPNPWQCIESLPGQSAVLVVWRDCFGDQFPTWLPFFNPRPKPVVIYPCLGTGCSFLVVAQPDGSITGLCQAYPPLCQPVRLNAEDLIPWRLNWQTLGRAICGALNLNSKITGLGLYGTLQIGSWSADAVPVILTVQYDSQMFRAAVAELGLRLGRPFILLSPTAIHMTVNCDELLAHAHAGFFALENLLTTKNPGSFRAKRNPEELFARFSPQSAPITPGVVKPGPRYMIRKGLGVWKLVFDGKEADLKHERGIFYVAYLLTNPPEQPIHGVDLAAKIPEMYRQQLGMERLVNPATGKSEALQSHARIQERNLSLDDAQALRALLRKERELEAILDDENESEPVKQEALRELESIAEFQKHHAGRTQDSAQRAARTVRQAIMRFHQKLLSGLDRSGKPHPVLHPFAQHLEKCLILPSARYAAPSASRARGSLAGSFTYEPPAGTIWAS